MNHCDFVSFDWALYIYIGIGSGSKVPPCCMTKVAPNGEISRECFPHYTFLQAAAWIQKKIEFKKMENHILHRNMNVYIRNMLQAPDSNCNPNPNPSSALNSSHKIRLYSDGILLCTQNSSISVSVSRSFQTHQLLFRHIRLPDKIHKSTPNKAKWNGTAQGQISLSLTPGNISFLGINTCASCPIWHKTVFCSCLNKI